jgi:hypothetical protein
MTASGVAGTRYVTYSYILPYSAHRLLIIGSELTSLLGSGPSICLALMPHRLACADLHTMGGAPNLRSPFPLLAVIKAQTLREGIVHLG